VIAVGEARQFSPRFRRFGGRVLRSQALIMAISAVLANTAAIAAAPPQASYFMPDRAASRIVTVARGGAASAEVTVLMQAIAIKETGPKQTIQKFGEVYAFNPAFFAVRKNEPTQITFWNLQPDDEHDFMLADPELRVLMYVDLPPLSETSYVFTFHRTGLYKFFCTMHPVMEGQILVIQR
jgi:plastocyanin